jgi:hypothetical protein
MRSIESRALLALALVAAIALVAVTGAFAAGSATKAGTAPSISSTATEVVQAELTLNGGIQSSTIKNVDYLYKVHRQCLIPPVSGGCMSYMNYPVEVYLCASSQLGVVYPESQRTVTDIRCTPRLTALSGSTGAFNGMPINYTNHKFRAYYVFIAPGAAGSFNPPLEGQTDSVTVSW